MEEGGEDSQKTAENLDADADKLEEEGSKAKRVRPIERTIDKSQIVPDFSKNRDDNGGVGGSGDGNDVAKSTEDELKA